MVVVIFNLIKEVFAHNHCVARVVGTSIYIRGILVFCVCYNWYVLCMEYQHRFLIMHTNTNQREDEEEDDCSICNESLPKFSIHFVRMPCCGKGMHKKCYNDIFKSSLSDECPSAV